mmetsp:Transcript_1035/g.1839  ORF Transcript_1035/g.1839 Transcript_1035/m.1839 type:complete len:592 (-) Transcript_1035:138-1913(-)
MLQSSSKTKDNHESSSPVLLLEPFSTKPSRPSKMRNSTNPRDSYLGGLPCYFPFDQKQEQKQEFESSSSCPTCDICKREMFLILQMHTPLNLENSDTHGDVESYNLDRTMLVFGCNHGPCLQQAFQQQRQQQRQQRQNTLSSTGKSVNYQDRFLMGGQGVVKCFRTQQPIKEEGKEQEEKGGTRTNSQRQLLQKDNDHNDDDGDNGNGNDTPEKIEGVSCEKKNDGTKIDSNHHIMGWGDDEGDDDNDWGLDQNDETSYQKEGQGLKELLFDMEDIEAMVSAMENNNEVKVQTQTQQNKTKKQDHHHSVANKSTWCDAQQSSRNVFPRFDLDMYDEPECCVEQGDSDDEDVITNSIHDNAAVQSLLTKYLEQEEDSEIVAVIRSGGKQTTSGGGSSISTSTSRAHRGAAGNDSVEKYEKLPPEDRAFLTFTAKVKWAPRQSVRYDYGGNPLWSIPTPNLALCSNNKERRHEVTFPVVPPCPCGAKREFEFQIMPSILHVLNVDKYATVVGDSGVDTTPKTSVEMNELFDKFSGGMNWGTIAVYSCSVSCKEYREEYVVVQESIDGDPKRVQIKMIPKNTGKDGDEVSENYS